MMSPYAARAAIVVAAVSLVTLAALHILKPDLHPSRTMISQYAGPVWTGDGAVFRGVRRGEWKSGCGDGAIRALTRRPDRNSLLLTAAVGLVMAARFPMDSVSTPPAQMSHTGGMHGVAFLLGVPSVVLAVLVLSVALGGQASYAGWLLMTVAAVIWISLIIMIGIMLRVGPGKPPDPNGPERFVGVPNRLLMVAYAVWLMVAAWPLVRG